MHQQQYWILNQRVWGSAWWVLLHMYFSWYKYIKIMKTHMIRSSAKDLLGKKRFFFYFYFFKWWKSEFRHHMIQWVKFQNLLANSVVLNVGKKNFRNSYELELFLDLTLLRLKNYSKELYGVLYFNRFFFILIFIFIFIVLLST